MALPLPDETETALLDLPIEVWTDMCQRLGLHDLGRVAATCSRFLHGEGGTESVELNIKSPVVAALREHAYPRLALSAITRPATCSESWVSYSARSVRQRRCQEAPPIAWARKNSTCLFVDAANRLLACGCDLAEGEVLRLDPIPMAGMADIQVRSVVAAEAHCLALAWDGRVYSWGENTEGQLGHGELLERDLPTLIEGLEAVCDISAYEDRSFAVTQSGDVFSWGADLEIPDLPPDSDDSEAEPVDLSQRRPLRPTLVEGSGGVRMRLVRSHDFKAFAVGENREVFSWGENSLGHGNYRHCLCPKRVEALRGIPVSSVAVDLDNALALAEDGLVYQFHVNKLPTPVEALRGVRVGSIAVDGNRSYAVAVTGELWTWSFLRITKDEFPKVYARLEDDLVPKPMESLRGVKVDAVVTGHRHTFVLADGGSVYVWDTWHNERSDASGVGSSRSCVAKDWRMPHHIPALRVACGM